MQREGLDHGTGCGDASKASQDLAEAFDSDGARDLDGIQLELPVARHSGTLTSTCRGEPERWVSGLFQAHDCHAGAECSHRVLQSVP
jgi:hypothetical protein